MSFPNFEVKGVEKSLKLVTEGGAGLFLGRVVSKVYYSSFKDLI